MIITLNIKIYITYYPEIKRLCTRVSIYFLQNNFFSESATKFK